MIIFEVVPAYQQSFKTQQSDMALLDASPAASELLLLLLPDALATRGDSERRKRAEIGRLGSLLITSSASRHARACTSRRERHVVDDVVATLLRTFVLVDSVSVSGDLASSFEMNE